MESTVSENLLPSLKENPQARSAIIIAEDSKVAEKIKQTFSSFNYEFSTVRNGCEALEMCTRKKPNWIIADWSRTGIDGSVFKKSFAEIDVQFSDISCAC